MNSSFYNKGLKLLSNFHGNVLLLFYFQENNVPCTKEEIQTIFQGEDKDGTGQLNTREFATSSKAVNLVKEAENSSVPISQGQKKFVPILT